MNSENDRKIITNDQAWDLRYKIATEDMFERFWNDLPDAPKLEDLGQEIETIGVTAPKHTDEEWEELIEAREMEALLAIERLGEISKLQARIKELEHTLENHGPEGHNVTNEQFTNMVKQWESVQVELIEKYEDEIRQRQLTEAALMTERNNVIELQARIKELEAELILEKCNSDGLRDILKKSQSMGDKQ